MDLHSKDVLACDERKAKADNLGVTVARNGCRGVVRGINGRRGRQVVTMRLHPVDVEGGAVIDGMAERQEIGRRYGRNDNQGPEVNGPKGGIGQRQRRQDWARQAGERCRGGLCAKRGQVHWPVGVIEPGLLPPRTGNGPILLVALVSPGRVIPEWNPLDLDNGVKLDLVLIPAGKFIMGTPEPEKPIVGQTMVE